jgi:hypothetical protein
LISIVGHQHKIEIVKNTFTGNSGTKGIIYLDTYDRGTTLPLVIAFNTFTRNAGYLDASAIYVRARGRSGQSIYSSNPLYVPDQTYIFCVGYHFE